MPATVRAFRLAAVALLATSPALAQVGAPAQRTGVSITPYLGVLIPTQDLFDYQGQVTKLSAAITFGGRLGVGIGQRIGIEGDVGYSPGSLEYSGAGAAINQDVRILTGSGRLTLYLIPRTSPFWLAIGGGVAAIRHTFKTGTAGSQTITPGTDVGGVIGASAGIRIGRIIAFHIGAEDYLYSASFDISGAKTAEKKQHDIRLTGGIRVPFLGF